MEQTPKPVNKRIPVRRAWLLRKFYDAVTSIHPVPGMRLRALVSKRGRLWFLEVQLIAGNRVAASYSRFFAKRGELEALLESYEINERYEPATV